MRTTVKLDPDVAAAVERLRHESGMGLSEALNHVARAGLTVKTGHRPFKQRSARLSLRIDVTNVAEAMEQLDGPAAR